MQNQPYGSNRLNSPLTVLSFLFSSLTNDLLYIYIFIFMYLYLIDIPGGDHFFLLCAILYGLGNFEST